MDQWWFGSPWLAFDSYLHAYLQNVQSIYDLRFGIIWNLKTSSIWQEWTIEHHTKYGQGGFGFLAFLHFLVGVFTYKCSTPLRSLHGFVHRFETCACGMYAHSTLIICAPPCQTSFLHTKSMLLKGDLLGFWTSIDWDFEAQPMFETMLWVDYTRKDGKLMLMSKML
jgi:hypothetical protein